MRRLLVLLILALPLVVLAAAPDSWTEGTVASGTAVILGEPQGAQTITLDPPLSEKLTGPTAVFYFAPKCPHCQAVAPEIAKLSKQITGLTWIGMATGSSEPADVEAFAAEHGFAFEMLRDESRGFSTAVQARSTPGLYLMEPAEGGFEGIVSATVTESYTPYRRGTAPVFAMRQHPDDPFADFDGYMGTTACSQCHVEEGGSWAMTLHARAYATLYYDERAEEADCVRCHVSGLDQGGFVMGDHGSPHANVGCESCHGPSGPHDGEATDASASCTGCHDKKHSIAFSLEKGLPHIDHYQINGMTDDEVRRRLAALQSGDVEKPLLAFPEGPTQGAAACVECHKSSHKGWRKGGHAEAIKSLPERQQGMAECLRCHATPNAFPATQQADAYRADGVSCESCHGAGTDHIAAPTKDNIVGLGESCPECVIEAICTQCHTPKWDPGWDLSTRLEALKH